MYKREDIAQVLESKGWKFMPCPFCGSMDIGIKQNHLDYKAGEGPCVSTNTIWAYCRYCGTEGKKKTADVVGLVDSVATALESWNYRKEDDKVSRNAVLDCIVRFSNTTQANVTGLIHDINELQS